MQKKSAYININANKASARGDRIKYDFFPIFLSVVLIVRNQADSIKHILSTISAKISICVNDYEIIIIDNASNDEGIAVLKNLTGEDGLPNLQVYALTKEVDIHTASWVGVENALGDFVLVIDPLIDDINFLPQMLDKALNGFDLVFANNKLHNGRHLRQKAPQYRLLSKRVINFILQHSQPIMTYRNLLAIGGFVRITLSYSSVSYSSAPMRSKIKRQGESMNLDMRFLVSTAQMPVRLVTSLAIFGSLANLIYSVCIIVIGLGKTNITPGWMSLSLQQSVMFFLISIVLLVLGEYILQMASLSNVGPLYHVGQEFTSAQVTRRQNLNIHEVVPKQTHIINHSHEGMMS